MYLCIANIFKYPCIARVYLLVLYIHNRFVNNKITFWGKYFPIPVETRIRWDFTIPKCTITIFSTC